MNSHLAQSLWFWLPLFGAALLASIFGGGSYYYARKEEYPRKVRASGFNGIVRETAKLTLLGSGAGFITSVLAKELKYLVFFKNAMFAVLLISMVVAILNYIMSAAIDTRTGNDGKSVELTTRWWATLHGIIYGLSLAAMIALLIAMAAFSAVLE